MSLSLNQAVLVSGVDYFNDQAAINPFMDASIPVNLATATTEHTAIRKAFETAGIKATQVKPPEGCQDGVYTANWGLERAGTVVLARLPNARQGEEAYAHHIFESLGKKVVTVPENWRFSGQGDALPCGNYLFCGSGYRSDPEAQAFAAETLGYERIQLQTIPLLDDSNQPVLNGYSGWPDSFFYDIDLALAVIKPPVNGQKGLIAWCPDAFVPESQQKLRAFDSVDKIEVSLTEAKQSYALNLVSTGETVIMNANAPQFQGELEARGLKTVLLSNPELAKGGGSIRCTSVCVSNS
jgi:N-dimethylarginine dimethylaminohydrolase